MAVFKKFKDDELIVSCNVDVTKVSTLRFMIMVMETTLS